MGTNSFNLQELYGNQGKSTVETRLDWKELNKFSLYTPILRVIGDAARKCGAEARLVQTENFLDDCAELMIELRRAGDSTLLDFNTFVQMIEDQGTLAADFSGVRRIVEVTCALLPNPQPSRLKEDADQVLMAAAEHQAKMAQQQAAQYQRLAAQLVRSPHGGMMGGTGTYTNQLSRAKEEGWGIDLIKAYLGLKP